MFLLGAALLHVILRIRRSRKSSENEKSTKRRRCRGCGCAGRRKRYTDKDESLPFHEPAPAYAITGEIRDLQTAVVFIEDFLEAQRSPENIRSPYARRSSTSTMATLPEYSSQVDLKLPEEELPEYEPNDGSEDGTVVADGFQYVPAGEVYEGRRYNPTGAEVWRARVDGVDVK